MSNPFLAAFLGGEPAPPTAGLLALEFGSGVFVSISSLASEVISQRAATFKHLAAALGARYIDMEV